MLPSPPAIRRRSTAECWGARFLPRNPKPTRWIRRTKPFGAFRNHSSRAPLVAGIARRRPRSSPNAGAWVKGREGGARSRARSGSRVHGGRRASPASSVGCRSMSAMVKTCCADSSLPLGMTIGRSSRTVGGAACRRASRAARRATPTATFTTRFRPQPTPLDALSSHLRSRVARFAARRANARGFETTSRTWRIARRGVAGRQS
jgi:hypothetical protein